MTAAKVWYCQKCRKAIKVEPRYLKMVWSMCECSEPVLPVTSTMVWGTEHLRSSK